jgi:hypothetical protein
MVEEDIGEVMLRQKAGRDRSGRIQTCQVSISRRQSKLALRLILRVCMIDRILKIDVGVAKRLCWRGGRAGLGVIFKSLGRQGRGDGIGGGGKSGGLHAGRDLAATAAKLSFPAQRAACRDFGISTEAVRPARAIAILEVWFAEAMSWRRRVADRLFLYGRRAASASVITGRATRVERASNRPDLHPASGATHMEETSDVQRNQEARRYSCVIGES